jgi:hypothetical protein
MHHRAQGKMLTQDQEELLLVGAFGLFWLGALASCISIHHSQP